MLRYQSTIIVIGILVSSLFSFSGIIKAQSLSFNHLSVEDGLSNNDVNTVIQDKTGFIWFGTEDGLNRFDGYNFKIFRNDPADSTSISNNSIWALMEDSAGKIWVGTVDGILNIFDPEYETFDRLIIYGEEKNQSSITALFEDSKGNIWVGTRSRGAYCINPVSNEIKNFNRDINDSTAISHHSVRSIMEDADGNIIIGTYLGLNKLNPNESKSFFVKFFSDENDVNSLSDDQIYNLSQSDYDPDIIWIGTPAGLTRYNSSSDTFERIQIDNPDSIQFGSGASTVIEESIEEELVLWIDTYGGLVRMNLNSGKSERYIHNENDPSSITDNQINKIMRDRSGVIWIVTQNGISYLSEKILKFNSSLKQTSVTDPVISAKKTELKAIHQNKSGDVWLGFSDGLIKLVKQNDNFKRDEEIKDLNVWSVTEDNNQSLWIGTFGQGLLQYDLKTGKMKEWLLRFVDRNTTAVLFVKSLLLDSRNNLWVGYWGSGLARIDLSSGNYKLWIQDEEVNDIISNSDVWCLKEDRLGRIWIGTLGGINLIDDSEEGKFQVWSQTKTDANTLSSNKIYTIHESVNHESVNSLETLLWLGTSNGLNRFLVKNNSGNSNLYDVSVQIKSYTVKDGLPDNSVNSILEDENGNLWLGTGSGISLFDVQSEKFVNFSSEDGISGKVMNTSAALKLENGLMLFGSKKGLNVFMPEEINLSSFKPNLVLTDFQIFNRSIEQGTGSPLKKNILSTDNIELSYNQNVFSFEFAALDFNSPQSIEYAYKMEGFDEDWTFSGNRRFVTYTNLNPGNYIFKVKSTNADGVWFDESISVRIIVNPPWWRTLWAYGLYIILIGIALYTIRRFELNRAKLRNELKLQQVETEQKTKLDEIKSRFFANLSHEFRTPLMLIKGPLEQLKREKNPQKFSEHFNIIERNSNRLKKLIDQLLELSQLENAAVKLKARKENIVDLLKGIIFSFESFAVEKNITLKFNSSADFILVWVDRDSLEKIITNIISNAIKFTPENGRVEIALQETHLNKNQYVEIIISDNGIGIANDKLKNIFNRFYQADDSSRRTYGGSGIGLALVKELVDLHKWEIDVNSSLKSGTRFKLLIPAWEDYLTESEKMIPEPTSIIISRNNGETNLPESDETESEIIDSSSEIQLDKDDKPAVLIVEDSDDVRKYLTNLLEDDYKIYQCKDGQEAIKAAIDIIPDLILSDIMMPSMDGLEFCQRIKSEWQTSDIPVIMLTARASTESKIEGLETGADDYLTKPFESRELKVRIKNLLKQRQSLKERFSKEFELFPHNKKISTPDDEFLVKALDIVKKNLNQNSFTAELLAKELFVSRTQLHRKINNITGKAPGQFIRSIKLKAAAEMLIENKLSVTQIAFEVGFGNPSQFTRAFSKQFNCLPSEFASTQKSKKVN